MAQEASGISNITASISSDSDTQSYNTSQSREFTLTPTGTTNEVVINTTCTDYDIIIITETVPVGTFLYPNSTNSIGYYGRLVSELVYSTGFNVSDIGSWNLLSPACMEVMSTYDSNCVQVFPTCVGMNRPLSPRKFPKMGVPHMRGDEPNTGMR